MAELELTPTRLVLAGLGVVITGILLAAGEDVYAAFKAWLILPTLPLDLRFIASYVLILLGIVLVIYGILFFRQTQIVGVLAYLFFPRGTSEQDMTLEFNEKRHYRRTIVNFKTSPPAAYYLPTDSYAWKLIKNRSDLWVSELDEEPNNPDYVKAWCEKRGYSFAPRVARREDLLNALNYSPSTGLDRRLEHVEYRYFYPLWYELFRDKKIPSRLPSRRSILNWSTMKAFPLDWWTLKLATTGKIRGTTVLWIPRPHYVQRWARSHGFEWSDRLPTMEDLLAKGGQKAK